MILLKKAFTIAKYIAKLKKKGVTIGFVPTMGALHAGHISLINQSKSTCDVTVSSIFINPTQFNDPKDFEKYPVTIDNDILLLEKAGCDLLFLPSIAEIYPKGTANAEQYNLGEIEFLLEGKYRSGHFQGVCQVVSQLLNIVQPDHLFLGQKDYQQCVVIKKLIQLMHAPIQLIIAQTVREPTGLAMSSRNARLNNTQRLAASAISKMLFYIKDNVNTSSLPSLEQYAAHFLLDAGFNKVDYVSIADAETLQPVYSSSEKNKMVVLIAAFIGEVRLIDNLVLQD